MNAFGQGLALSLGLIVAIGAQNAFVLRQGLRREHVGSVVVLCAVADAVLIALGVWGMAQALGDRPTLALVLSLGGAAFLAWYGWRAFARVFQTSRLQATPVHEPLSRAAVLAQAAAFTQPDVGAELLLQLAHRMAECRLRQAQHVGRSCQRALLFHFLHDGQVHAFQHDV